MEREDRPSSKLPMHRYIGTGWKSQIEDLITECRYNIYWNLSSLSKQNLYNIYHTLKINPQFSCKCFVYTYICISTRFEGKRPNLKSITNQTLSALYKSVTTFFSKQKSRKEIRKKAVELESGKLPNWPNIDNSISLWIYSGFTLYIVILSVLTLNKPLLNWKPLINVYHISKR